MWFVSRFTLHWFSFTSWFWLKFPSIHPWMFIPTGVWFIPTGVKAALLELQCTEGEGQVVSPFQYPHFIHKSQQDDVFGQQGFFFSPCVPFLMGTGRLLCPDKCLDAFMPGDNLPARWFTINRSITRNFVLNTRQRCVSKKDNSGVLCVGTATAPRGIVICPVRTNKTSNSIPSVIKGYLDRNINISLKSNQML